MLCIYVLDGEGQDGEFPGKLNLVYTSYSADGGGPVGCYGSDEGAYEERRRSFFWRDGAETAVWREDCA